MDSRSGLDKGVGLLGVWFLGGFGHFQVAPLPWGEFGIVFLPSIVRTVVSRSSSISSGGTRRCVLCARNGYRRAEGAFWRYGATGGARCR